MSRFSFADAKEKMKEMLDDHSNIFSKARSLVSGDSQFFTEEPKPEQIRKLLSEDKYSISEKKEGMKRVIAGICKGNDMSEMFPVVVKNIHVQSIEFRKLVYFFIVHYAEDRPNETLLSISAFQKDLLDPSMHVRSLALRMLSSIRIPAIHHVVMIAVRKCSTDIAPIVRKTAAISLAQVRAVVGADESKELIIQLLHQFLGDKSIEVIGAAALSYTEICPQMFHLIHKHFRRLCRSLIDCDEWSQVAIMHVLLRYARTQFTDPNVIVLKYKSKVENDDSDVTTPESSENENSDSEQDVEAIRLHPDHSLLIDCVKPLLASSNRAVVVGAVSLLFHVAPLKVIDHCMRPLLRILNGPTESHMVVLSLIYSIILVRPDLFVPRIGDFFFNPEDSDNVRQIKVRIIAGLCRPQNFLAVCHEFRSYLRSFYPSYVVIAVHGLGLISATNKENANAILQLITPLLSHKCPEVVTECVVVLRQLVVQGSNQMHTVKIVYKLLLQLLNGEIKEPAAKASIIWLVGENISMHVAIAKAAPDCFRLFSKSFSQEDPQVKKQILTLGTKLWLHLEGEGEIAERFKKIFFYVLELVKYDNDYELRDRGRIIECAIDRKSVEFSSLKTAMLAPKPFPQQRDPYFENNTYQLGSFSHICGSAMSGYQELPSWLKEPPLINPREDVIKLPENTSNKDESETSDVESSSTNSSYTESDYSSETTEYTGSSSSSSSESSGSTSSSQLSSSGEKEVKASPTILPARKIITKIVHKGGR